MWRQGGEGWTEMGRYTTETTAVEGMGCERSNGRWIAEQHRRLGKERGRIKINAWNSNRMAAGLLGMIALVMRAGVALMVDFDYESV
jgi:hypothetical protein